MLTTKCLCNRLGYFILGTFFCGGVAFGWSDASHKAIVRGAIPVLPQEILPFFLENREFIAEHSLDPDYVPDRTPEQRAEHFFDIDVYLTEPSMSRPENDEKYGREAVIERGLLPWAIEREYKRLREAFRAENWEESRLAAAHLAHFVADAHMPLHSTVNYDGNLTGNDGIHNRFEIELVGRYHGGAYVDAANPYVLAGKPVEVAFAEIKRSIACVPIVLRADTEARRVAPLDSEKYYAEFDRLAGQVADVRLRDSATSLASFYRSAWEEAGKPNLPPRKCIVLLYDQDDPRNGEAAFMKILTDGVVRWAGPFDAVGAIAANSPKHETQLTLGFVAVVDIGQDGEELLTKGGDATKVLALCAHALEQFPQSERYLIVVSDGWGADPTLPQTAIQLKAQGVRVKIYGTPPQIGQDVQRFALDSGGRYVECDDVANALLAVEHDFQLP